MGFLEDNIEYILLGILVFIIIKYMINIYNGFVSGWLIYKGDFAKITVVLKNRADSVSKLADVAMGYMKHEKETFMGIAKARSGLETASKAAQLNPGNSGLMAEFGKAELILDKAIGGFQLKMEDYPELKANEAISVLTEEIISIENSIKFARLNFNNSVIKYNTNKQQFPNVILAPLFGFSKNAMHLEFEESVKELNRAPNINM